MKLEDTVERMLSGDYKERIIAEYQQIGIRIEGLRGFIFRYEQGLLTFEPASKIEVYMQQLEAMEQYQDCLAKRIKDEKIPGFGCFGDTCSI